MEQRHCQRTIIISINTLDFWCANGILTKRTLFWQTFIEMAMAIAVTMMMVICEIVMSGLIPLLCFALSCVCNRTHKKKRYMYYKR